MRASAADRVFRIAMALAPPSAGACCTGSVILTAKLITGHGAVASGGNRGQDDPGAAGVLDLDPVRRRAPALRGVQRVGPRQAAMPGYAAAESAAPAQAVRAQEDANARSVRLPVPASR
jgi:hypothetical protein